MAKKFGSTFKKHLVKSSEKEIKRVSVEFFNEVVKSTPVDTGAAQKAWKIDNKGRDKADVRNDTEYILLLNNGSSKKAPKGFIEQAIAITRRKR